jgi:hypothetical protein
MSGHFVPTAGLASSLLRRADAQRGPLVQSKRSSILIRRLEIIFTPIGVLGVSFRLIRWGTDQINLFFTVCVSK